MKQKGRIGWIIGIVLAGMSCLFLLILLISSINTNVDNDSPTMSVEEMSAHCYRASELFVPVYIIRIKR